MVVKIKEDNRNNRKHKSNRQYVRERDFESNKKYNSYYTKHGVNPETSTEDEELDELFGKDKTYKLGYLEVTGLDSMLSKWGFKKCGKWQMAVGERDMYYFVNTSIKQGYAIPLKAIKDTKTIGIGKDESSYFTKFTADQINMILSRIDSKYRCNSIGEFISVLLGIVKPKQ